MPLLEAAVARLLTWLDAMLDSKPFNVALNSLLASEALVMAGWTVPATYVLKAAYLRWMSKSKLMERVMGKAVPQLMLVLAAVVWRNWRRLGVRRRAAEAAAAGAGLSSYITPRTPPRLRAWSEADASTMPRSRRAVDESESLAATGGSSGSVKGAASGGASGGSSDGTAGRVVARGGAGASSRGAPNRSTTSAIQSVPMQTAVAAGDATVRAMDLQSQFYRATAAFALLQLLNRAYNMVHDNAELIIQMDELAVEREVKAFKPPDVKTLMRVVRPYWSIMDPVFIGIDNIPQKKPLLFVSNHTIMGFEFPLLLAGLFQKKGIFLRALADHSHFQIPINGHILRNVLGMVDGTPRNTDILMEQGEAVFVYPGGARETFKKTTDKPYEIFWEGHHGFARMAVKHQCTIVPVINLGTEDMFTVARDLPMGWIPVPFLWGGDRTFPLLKAELKNLQRVYFVFGQPIDTSTLGTDDDAVLEAFERTQREVLRGIQFLHEFRKGDPRRMAVDRLPRFGSWIGAKHKQQERMRQGRL